MQSLGRLQTTGQKKARDLVGRGLPGFGGLERRAAKRAA